LYLYKKLELFIGKKVSKISGKKFKSSLNVNTISGVIIHPFYEKEGEN